jgi:hypothetical protein
MCGMRNAEEGRKGTGMSEEEEELHRIGTRFEAREVPWGKFKQALPLWFMQVQCWYPSAILNFVPGCLTCLTLVKS